MISFETSRFGMLEVSSDKIITFPEGILGFPDVKRYILMDYKDTLLKWLQAVDEPNVAFIVIPPQEIVAGYTLKIETKIEKLLGAETADDIIVFVILRVDGENVTANLQGPLAINSINKKGVQLIIDDPNISCKTELKSLSSTNSSK